jgi:hypothetical protein
MFQKLYVFQSAGQEGAGVTCSVTYVRKNSLSHWTSAQDHQRTEVVSVSNALCSVWNLGDGESPEIL